VYVANLTAFTKNRVDLDAMCSHAEFLIKAGITGLCPAGTTGEFLYLKPQEKRELFSALIDGFGERVDIWCCTWDADADTMAALCRHVSAKGADGIFLPPPLYYEFTEKEIIDFYEFVRRNSEIPVYCYNIPKYTNNEISLSALEKMADSGSVAGIKDSSANEDRVREMVARFGDVLDIVAGGDHFVLRAKELGANGFISALANIYPELFVKLWNSPTEEAQAGISRIRSAIKGYGGISALKHLLSRRGHVFGCRFPFQELDEAQKRSLDELLQD